MKTKELKNILEKHKANKRLLKPLNNIKLIFNDLDVTLITVGIEQTTVSIIENDTSIRGEVVFDYESLYKILKTIKTREVLISESNSEIRINDLPIIKQHPENFALTSETLKIIQGEEKFRSQLLLDEKMIETLLNTENFMGKDEKLSVLSYVLVDHDYVVATDGRMMLLQSHRSPIQEPFLVPSNFIKKLKYFNKNYTAIRISKDNISISDTITTIYEPQISVDRYPDYKSIIPQDYNYKWKGSFITALSLETLRRLLTLKPRNDEIILYFNGSEIQTSCIINDADCSMKLPSLNVSKENDNNGFKIRYNIKFLLTCIKSMKDEMTQIQAPINHRQPLIIKDSERFALLMPRRDI